MIPVKPSDIDLYALSNEESKKLGIRRLPRNLFQAIEALKKDKLAEKVMGKVMLNSYVTYKNDEWERYHQAVTDWEIKGIPKIILTLMNHNSYKKFSNLFQKNKFKGYFQSENSEFDNIISEVGPGSPCGEFLRRYWHPVALSSELKKQPKGIKILDEDLVLFRTPKKELGTCSQKLSS